MRLRNLQKVNIFRYLIVQFAVILLAGCTNHLPSKHFPEGDLRAPAPEERHNYLFVAVETGLTTVEVHMPEIWGRRYCWNLQTGDLGEIAFARMNHGRIHAAPFNLRIYKYIPDAPSFHRPSRVFNFTFDHLFDIPPVEVKSGGKLFYVTVALGPGPKSLLIARGWEDLSQPSNKMPKFIGDAAADYIEIFGKKFTLADPVDSRFIVP